MTYQNLLIGNEEGITTITFNRPKALNALNGMLLDEFSQALDTIAADEDIRLLVLTGAGEKAFVAGADISELATFNALQAKFFAQKGQAVINKLTALPIPAIAAVFGKNRPGDGSPWRPISWSWQPFFSAARPSLSPAGVSSAGRSSLAADCPAGSARCRPAAARAC